MGGFLSQLGFLFHPVAFLVFVYRNGTSFRRDYDCYFVVDVNFRVGLNAVGFCGDFLQHSSRGELAKVLYCLGMNFTVRLSVAAFFIGIEEMGGD